VRMFLETMTLLRIDFAAIESNLEFHHEPTRGGSDAEAVGALLSSGHGRDGVPCANLGIPVPIARPRAAALPRIAGKRSQPLEGQAY
jgi:hypothetical protein